MTDGVFFKLFAKVVQRLSFCTLWRILIRGTNTIGLVKKNGEKLYGMFTRNLKKYDLWDLTNCISSIDRKYCLIKKYKTRLYNTIPKFRQATVCADADGIFLTIIIGEAGRMSDGACSVLLHWEVCLTRKGKFHNPNQIPLPNDNVDFSFYFVGDEAFTLQKNLKCSYTQEEFLIMKKQYLTADYQKKCRMRFREFNLV